MREEWDEERKKERGKGGLGRPEGGKERIG